MKLLFDLDQEEPTRPETAMQADSPISALEQYVKALAEVIRQGDAREESLYPALSQLMQQAAHAWGITNVKVTQQPRPTEAGNPDFRVWDGQSRIIGYVEAKSPDKDQLDLVEDSEQLRRYRETFPNLILTNFLEFRLYRNGQRVETVLLGSPKVLYQLKAAPPTDSAGRLWEVLRRFLEFRLPPAASAEQLASQLAKRCGFLREIVGGELAQLQQRSSRRSEDSAAALPSSPGALHGFFEAFREFLLGDLTPETFADLYAQTITYGLFAARFANHNRNADAFSRRKAFENIPRTVGVLRELFRYISLEDLPPELEWIVDDIAHVLGSADVRQILEEYYRSHRGEDPVVHFYETFLAAYNPEERQRRGVYYTPEPVVDYIVRAVHELLQSHFGLPEGLASREVTLLDPAAGTMTFVARAAQQAVEEFSRRYGVGACEAFIREHILCHFFGFELMVAPYAIGHLKMGFYLEELGHRLAEGERVPLYLTNTLDMSELEQTRLPGLSSLAEESRQAGRIKKQQPILVIIGNPPYSGHSANQGEWIRRLIEDYKQVDGRPLGEKNPKWLQDDYVKFLRFAEWKIAQAGRGIVGMITNHSYLDNPTFRGMRQHLMRTFDEIYVLNLHGNSLKREVCPDGSPDENVFDIRQGVAIALFVKYRPSQDQRQSHAEERLAAVRYADLWGSRQEKSQWLRTHGLKTTRWRRLRPKSEYYLFAPLEEKATRRYHGWPKVTDIFPVNSVGIVTARDRLTIHWTPQQVWAAVLNFSGLEPEMARRAYQLGTKVSTERIQQAQDDLRQTGPSRDLIVRILYRPFDVRYTYYTGRANGFHERPRPEVMRHMLAGKNIALIVPRRVEQAGGWQHALVTNRISEHVAVSLKTIDYHFPLYLYPSAQPSHQEKAGHKARPKDKRPQANLAPQLLDALTEHYQRKVKPEEVLAYVYAVLYTPLYRRQYAELLRIDFPRIPFPQAEEVFRTMARLGQKLIDFHLLQSPELAKPNARFEGYGDGRIGKSPRQGVRYQADCQRVYINATQYFAPVPAEVWEYRIGGYQVCQKWLKDRADRALSLDEIQTYLRILTALGQTLSVQQQLDECYQAVETAALSLSALGFS